MPAIKASRHTDPISVVLMSSSIPLVLSWSGGKDSAMALYELLRDPAWKVERLLTSVSDEFRRVSHHGIREELLEMQAAAIGLPLDWLRLPSGGGPCTN